MDLLEQLHTEYPWSRFVDQAELGRMLAAGIEAAAVDQEGLARILVKREAAAFERGRRYGEVGGLSRALTIVGDAQSLGWAGRDIAAAKRDVERQIREDQP
jgi:hypothetical protein